MLFFARFLVGLLPLGGWVLAGYLGWTWWEGDQVVLPDGSVDRVREDWPLWTIAGLALWLLAGRWILVALIAKPDRPGDRLELKRENGRMLEDGGAPIYIEEHGPSDGVPVVLTHGWGLDSRMWHQAKQALGKDYRVVLWDLPGLGRSRSQDVKLETFANSLKRVVQATGADKVVLVGHSIGGMTIQTLVRDDPAFVEDRVAAIALFNTTPIAPQNTMVLSGLVRALRFPVIEPVLWLSIILEPLSWLSAWQSYLSGTAQLINRLGCSGSITRSQLNAITLLQVKNRPSVQARGDLAMFRWDSQQAMTQWPRPVLVVGGQADLVTKPVASEQIARMAPRAQLLIHSGVNHMGPVDHASAYWRDMRGFLERTGIDVVDAGPPSVAAE